jgi:hypothetical protein
VAGRTLGNVTRWVGGIANSKKEGPESSFAWGRSIEFRADARQITILPKTAKESGSIVTDLPMWGARIPANGNTYFYGNTGNLYLRTSTPTWSVAHTAPSSSGNGLAYLGEDYYLYYAQDKTLGRYGPNPGDAGSTWYDGFIESQGGAPTNTNSLQLLSASSQYADRADTASLSITGDLTLEAYINPTSLPTAGNTMALISKWDESGATRSYMLDINAVSGYFGDGSDGALTISADTTEAPIDSACTGTSGAMTLSATNASFAANQVIFIHQTQGTGAGTWMRNTIASYTAGTITLTTALNANYVSGAQVRVLKQYTNVTINTGVTYTAKAWNGSTGGILAFIANGTVTVTGTISANGGNGSSSSGAHSGGGTGGGFRGGDGFIGSPPNTGYQGESSTGIGGQSTAANGMGGGGNYDPGSPEDGSGGGGGHATSGANGIPDGAGAIGGTGGGTGGAADLTTMLFGGAGGGAGTESGAGGAGGAGGGAIFITGATLTVSGAITANGGSGGSAATGSGGGGAGGSILLKSQTATLGSALISAVGGSGGVGPDTQGGAGGTGRVHLDYYTAYSGTTSPTLNVTQDSSLVINTTYQARLNLSSTGSNSEVLSKAINPIVGTWTRISVAWQSSTSTATFYQDAVSLGSVTGALTAINDNASRFAVGKNTNGAAAAANFYNGLIDDVRVWNTVLNASQVSYYLNTVLTGSESFIQAYYKFDNAYTDTTANANDLTASGTPTFSSSVPFSGVTTRGDQDQQHTDTGQDYDLLTTISEAAVDVRSFVPAKDPQKSIRFYINAVGTGNWTVTIHDALNRTAASLTVTNASLNTGFYEFVFATAWRPVVGATYHAHITSTVADGGVRTSVDDDFSAADYATFFQILVNDVYHPMAQHINFLAIGNERYLATWNGLTYNPMRLTFPAGYRVRSLGFWREYLAIGVWKGSTITDYEEGIIFFWDGISVTYNFYIDIPEGGVNALRGTKGTLYIWAGYTGDILTYGGSVYGSSVPAAKLRRLPHITQGDVVEVLPGAVTVWRSLVHFGIGVSTSTSIERGVYSWGALDGLYQPSLGYDYPISTGNRGSTVKVGCLLSVGQKLFVGWQDNTSFGVDTVDPTGSPFATATVEHLISDFGTISQQKQPLTLRADFNPLRAGESITVKYRADRATNWNSVQITVSTVGATQARLNIQQKVREFEGAADLTGTTTSPTLLGFSLEADPLKGEVAV